MTLQDYFDHYQKAHLHPANRLCHGIGIPAILVALSVIVFTSHRQEGWILFAIGWIFQLVGHLIERNWPEFLQNPVYLVIGPLFFLNKIQKKLSKPKE